MTNYKAIVLKIPPARSISEMGMFRKLRKDATLSPIRNSGKISLPCWAPDARFRRNRDVCCRSQLWLVVESLPVLPFLTKGVAVHNTQ